MYLFPKFYSVFSKNFSPSINPWRYATRSLSLFFSNLSITRGFSGAITQAFPSFSNFSTSFWFSLYYRIFHIISIGNIWNVFESTFTRACLKKAFCKMCVTICGRFCPDEGAVAGYGNWIRAKYTAKWGVQIAGMIFQTGSST